MIYKQLKARWLVTSLKQKAANRRNALHSTGPRTEEGQRRVSVNALKHGLTAPIEATPWASAVSDVEALLAADGFAAEEGRELARRIVEYERNVEYQRQRFLGEAINPAPAVVISAQLQADLQEIDDLMEFAELEDDAATLRFAQSQSLKLVKLHERIAARQNRINAREATDALKSADRYHRRAANQLIKQLKSLGDQ